MSSVGMLKKDSRFIVQLAEASSFGVLWGLQELWRLCDRFRQLQIISFSSLQLFKITTAQMTPI